MTDLADLKRRLREACGGPNEDEYADPLRLAAADAIEVLEAERDAAEGAAITDAHRIGVLEHKLSNANRSIGTLETERDAAMRRVGELEGRVKALLPAARIGRSSMAKEASGPGGRDFLLEDRISDLDAILGKTP